MVLVALVAGCSGPRGALFEGRRVAPLSWGATQRFVASDAAELDEFGRSVSLSAAGDRALVGAYGESAYRGAAYVFVRNGNAWTEEQKLVANDGAELDKFGWAVSLDGDRALVGAYGRDGARGAAYVFVRSGNAWTEEQKLAASDGGVDDNFGYAIALTAGRVVVGAPGKGGFRGAGYVFLRSGETWTEEQKLAASDGAAFDNFGNSVSIAGDHVLVGAPWNSDLRGAVYTYLRSGSPAERPWTEEQKLALPDDVGSGRFGGSLSLTAERVLIGSSGSEAAYVFARDGSAAESPWGERQRVVAGDGEAGALFGWSVSLAANAALVGASYADQLRGAAYVFMSGVEGGDASAADGDVAGGEDGGPNESGNPGSRSCTRGEDCASGYCEDGICCDRTCSPSERCRADLKVFGGDGTCGPAKAAAPRAPCRFDVQCTSGLCADGACLSPSAEDALPAGSGCGCASGGSTSHLPRAWFGGTLALIFLRRPRRRTVASRAPRCGITLALTLVVFAFGGCVGVGSRSASAHDGGESAPGGGPGTGGAASGNPLLPARVRRLTNAEYAASVFALLGVDAEAAVAGFPPDATQRLGFSVNDAQIVSSVLAGRLDSTAQALVAAARQNGQFDFLAPCSDPSSEAEACARAFIQSFGARAYRRPLTTDEVEALLTLYQASTGEGGSYDDGIDFVTRALLQAPGFIYLTELGDSSGSSSPGKTTLTPYEIASLLAYVATAAPPDKALLEDVNTLVTADRREAHLRRLLSTREARTRLVRIVREWLGIDRIAEIDKDSNVYPSFAGNHAAIAAESVSFIDDVLNSGTGTLQELLGAEWTIIEPTSGATEEEISSYYADIYGLGGAESGGARTTLAGARGGARVGILNQGAFLSQFGTATGSNPVLRGVAVMRRVVCLELPDPVELDITVVPPVPNPLTPKTTRELYAAHAADPLCQSCHDRIDGFGFAFEQYDGVGAFRPNGQETVKTPAGAVLLPVNTATTVVGTGTDLDGDYGDSNALARALSGSAAVRTCMARQLFRATAGRSDLSVRGAEDNFVTRWRQLPADRQSSLIETLVAFVKSDVFVERSAGP